LNTSGCISRYEAFGLCLASNKAVPGLLSAPVSRATDFVLWIDETPPTGLFRSVSGEPWYVTDYCDARGQPGLVILRSPDGRRYQLIYSDGARYWFDLVDNVVWANRPAELPLQDLYSYLLGPVMGCLLRILGTTCLHASGVAVGGRSFLFVGPAHAGKSTTAIALARRGCAVLTDDIAPLVNTNTGMLTLPAYPRLRLRQGTLSALARTGQHSALPAAPDSGRLHVDLAEQGLQFQTMALPLGGVYLLEERSNQPTVIVPVSSGRGLVELLANTYAARLPERRMRTQDFQILGQVATTIPLRRLCAHADPDQLDALCDVLLADISSLDPIAA